MEVRFLQAVPVTVALFFISKNKKSERRETRILRTAK